MILAQLHGATYLISLVAETFVQPKKCPTMLPDRRSTEHIAQRVATRITYRVNYTCITYIVDDIKLMLYNSCHSNSGFDVIQRTIFMRIEYYKRDTTAFVET